MENISQMIGAHPKRAQANPDLQMLMQETMMCQAACVICADACLSETDVQSLTNCIALNNDCADVCAATSRLAGRVGHHNQSVMVHQLQACREVCRLCAEECEMHPHQHCKVCADACRRCEEVCARVVDSVMAMA